MKCDLKLNIKYYTLPFDQIHTLYLCNSLTITLVSVCNGPSFDS